MRFGWTSWFVSVLLVTSELTQCLPSFRQSRVFQPAASLTNQLPLNSPVKSVFPPSASKSNEPPVQQSPTALSVLCHDDSMDIVVDAAQFAGGFPVQASELRLGSGASNFVSGGSCAAFPSGPNQFTISAHLKDCGTKLSMTSNYLVYSNVLVYSPQPSVAGVVHTAASVITVQCQYQRLFYVDNAAVVPTWIPFGGSEVATDVLEFSLHLMSDDWQSERGSNFYFLGDEIHLQATVTVAKHVPLLLFVDQCVATPTPDISTSDVKYSFIDNNGCLSDSWISSSRSQYLKRTQGNTLNLLLDAFRFQKMTGNLVYITCYLKAVPAASAVNSQNRACSFIGGRWQSVDGSDEVCTTCDPSKRVAADAKPIKSYRITAAPPVKPVKPTKPPMKALPADFIRVKPGQSLESFKDILQWKRPTYSNLKKRGTDSNEDWMKKSLGPILLFPEYQATNSDSTGSPQLGSVKDLYELVTEEPKLSLNSSESRSLLEEVKVASAQESGRFSDHFRSFKGRLNDLSFLDLEEGSGSEERFPTEYDLKEKY